MRRLSHVASLSLVVAMAACSTLPQRYQLTAEPLETAAVARSNAGGKELEAVHDLVQDSQTKCAAFVNSMFARTAGTNTILGIVGTIFSAAASVVSPIATSHILSGGSTITTGARTSIDTEYLNSLTISHITQAIQTTYGSDMQKYIAYLNSKNDDTAVSAAAERSTILSYHNECSLSSADGSIASSLQPGQGSSQTSSIAVSYAATVSDTTAAAVASGLMTLINNDDGFAKAGIKATMQTSTIVAIGAPPAVKLTVTPAPVAGHVGAVITNGPPYTLTVSGTPQPRDIITVSATTVTQQAGTAPAAAPLSASRTGPPPAAALGPGAKPLAGVSGTAPISR
jgi:hypothetical protein